MMGYRDPNDDYTAEYWDDYLAEFGPGAYVEARYMDENRWAPGTFSQSDNEEETR